MRPLAFQAGVVLGLLSLGAALTLLSRLQRAQRIEERLRQLRAGSDSPASPLGGRLAGLLQRLGQAALDGGPLGAATLAELRRTVAGAAITGLVLPDAVLRWLRDRHRARVERGLADALDLMVICAEAGLALEAAVALVATEMREANRALAEEFAATGAELRTLPDRRLALLKMGERTGLEPLRRLGGTLAQTPQCGTPLAQALRLLAAELRQERQMRFEARAARLPVILALPTILFILPCIFLVVGGPAALRAIDSFAAR